MLLVTMCLAALSAYSFLYITGKVAIGMYFIDLDCRVSEQVKISAAIQICIAADILTCSLTLQSRSMIHRHTEIWK